MIQTHCPESSFHIIYDPQLYLGDPGRLFNKDWIVESSTPQGPHGSVVYLSVDSKAYAWKRYRRRGLIARFCRKHYGWRRLGDTRMWREFDILSRLFDMGLPVPRPVAARCRYHKHVCYTGDLLTLHLKDTANLRDLLQQEAIEPAVWFEIGRAIGSLHHHSVRHGDLNASNILVHPGGAVHLVDFDKSSFQAGSHSWKPRNLNRLHASLTKLAGRFDPFYFRKADWSQLLKGYHS